MSTLIRFSDWREEQQTCACLVLHSASAGITAIPSQRVVTLNEADAGDQHTTQIEFNYQYAFLYSIYCVLINSMQSMVCMQDDSDDIPEWEVSNAIVSI